MDSAPATDDVAALRNELAILESQVMREAWGDFVDRREYLYDDPSFGVVGSLRAVQFTSPDDRKDGSFRPVYETETDLSMIRAAARNLVLLTSIRTGAIDALANYTFSEGFDFKAEPEDETFRQSVELASVVQGVLDRFLDENDFNGVIDREIHMRSREDGECFLAFDEEEIRNGRVLVEFIEPDCIVQPRNAGELDEWLGTWFPSCWKFGVHCPEHKTWKALGYHVVRDGRGADWDYIPAHRMEHVKRNVTRNAKRGVSDFFEIIEDLRRESKLCTNMVAGAALQSAIAWILQGAQGQTQSQLSGVGGESRRTTTAPSPLGPNATTTVRNAAHYPPGSVLRVGYGQEYKAGPMGAERNQGFQLVGAYVLRKIGVRWNMPEYMISGDASNANYSSSLVAEAPFVKAREADQQFYKRHFLSLLWKVVRIHCESGRFAKQGIGREDYDKLLKLVRIDAECPTVASRDQATAVAAEKTLVDGGVMSEQTWAARNGLDFDKEQKLGAAKAPPPAPAFGSPFGSPFQRQGAQSPVQDAEGADPEEVPAQVPQFMESWNEADHPRDDNGRFVSTGEIAAAGSDSAKAEELRSRVTNPKERTKLDMALGVMKALGKGALWTATLPFTFGDRISRGLSSVADKVINTRQKYDPFNLSPAERRAVPDVYESTRLAAVSAALESVETTEEARIILESLNR